MPAFFKKLITIAIICIISYLAMGYHYIIIDNSVKMLKKSKLTLKYTIYSTKGKPIERVLSVPELWEDGLGDLMLKEGKISEAALEKIRLKMEGKEEEEYY